MAGFLGEVGLLQDTRSGIDVGKVEGGTGVAGVEDGGKTNARLEGLHHDAMHFVVDDVTSLSEIDRIDDFVVPIVFVAIEILRLAAMTC